MNYAKHMTSTQREPLPGQVPNSAGGFTFPVDDWTQLDRFLILGAEGGSYYASERELTKANAAAVQRCIDADGGRAVARIVEISDAGRAPKNDPALFALALAAKCGNFETRRAAFAAVTRVARIGTHLFHFAEYVNALGGWGRGTMGAFARWYGEMPTFRLAEQAIKYQQRDGWAHRDLLRKAHPKTTDETRNAIFNWMVKGWPSVGPEPHPDAALSKIWAFEKAKTARGAELVRLIEEYRLPHECVPNEAKGDPNVWAAMLPSMGLTALIRNLGKMTAVDLIAPLSAAGRAVADRLADADAIKAARVHPLQILVALSIYARGAGEKGSLTWTPAQAVVTALDDAFYLAFKAVEPTGKRTLLALDISGSMDNSAIAGMPGISPRVGSAAMALITANVETDHAFVGFTSSTGQHNISERGISQLSISPRQRLDDVVRYTAQLPMGGTDCSLPMMWATLTKTPVDTFVIYTDSETWAGNVQPVDALREYRQKTGIPAKMIVVGMVSNGFTLADPRDGGMLDVVGFDTAAPAVMADFARA
jgi:60 kDa SS-A/Ro ribonucleoprotein